MSSMSLMLNSDLKLSSGRDEKKKKEDNEIQVPVLNIFLMKQIVEDDGKLELVGTFIQHCYETVETRNMVLERIKDDQILFDYRFNDETADEDSGFTRKRRTEKVEGTDMGTVYRHTFQVKAPLDVNVEFDFFPFRVATAKLLVELSSMTTTDNEVRLRPDLLLHLPDKTDMFAIQKDPLKNPKGLKPFDLAKDRLDRTQTYDFVSPFPKVSFLYDKKKGYCPKFLLKFMLVEDGMKKLVEILAPMFLIAGMNTIHVLNFDEEVDTADYIANSATFALSVMVFLPTMVGTSRVQKLFTVNNLYIVCIFVALTLSSIPDTFAGHKRWAIAGMLMNWISFIFPIGNSVRYWYFIRKAKQRANAGHFWPPDDKKPYKATTKKAKHLFATVGEVVAMESNEARYELEYKLQDEFSKKQKTRVLEFASSTAVARKNSGRKPRSDPTTGAAAQTDRSAEKQRDPEKKDAPEKIDEEATTDDHAASPVKTEDVPVKAAV